METELWYANIDEKHTVADENKNRTYYFPTPDNDFILGSVR